MKDDLFFRWFLVAGFCLFVPIGVYHRLKARTGEKLDRRQEGWVILIGLRLSAAVALAAIIAWINRPSSLDWASVPMPVFLRWVGVGLGACAIALLAWTLHSLGRNLTDTVVTRKEHTLVTHGPYRWIRHPFYASGALLGIASSLIAANWLIFVLGAIPIVLLLFRSRKEEENLIARFGDAYRDSMRRTGRLMPRFGRIPPVDPSRR